MENNWNINYYSIKIMKYNKFIKFNQGWPKFKKLDKDEREKVYIHIDEYNDSKVQKYIKKL